jgi:hypothetical protein
MTPAKANMIRGDFALVPNMILLSISSIRFHFTVSCNAGKSVKGTAKYSPSKGPGV